MLAPWSVYADSATWLRAALCGAYYVRGLAYSSLADAQSRSDLNKALELGHDRDEMLKEIAALYADSATWLRAVSGFV